MKRQPIKDRRSLYYSSSTLFKLTLLAFFLSLTVKARAQVFYSYPGASVVKENHPAVGPFTAVGNHFFRIGGFGRFNITTNMDMGVELTVDGASERWFAGAAGDVKYAIVPRSFEIPFDWAVNAGIGFTSGNNRTTLIVPIGSVISRPLEFADGTILTPFGGIYVLILNSSKGSDADVELRMGAELKINSDIDVFSALHLGYGTKFYLGLNVRL